MERKVVCPHCKEVQAGLVLVDGKLYAMRDEQIGTRILGYVCRCGRRVHYGEREGAAKVKLERWKTPQRQGNHGA